jgi:hypothetical protein
MSNMAVLFPLKDGMGCAVPVDEIRELRDAMTAWLEVERIRRAVEEALQARLPQDDGR